MPYSPSDINTLTAQAESLGLDVVHHNKIADDIEASDPSADDKARADKHRRVAIASDEIKTLVEELVES